MIDLIFDIAALIGFAAFCCFAFIGIKFTMIAWAYTVQIHVNEMKARRLKKMSPEVAKAELDKLLKEIEKEDEEKSQ